MRGHPFWVCTTLMYILHKLFFVIYTVHPAVQPPVQICRYAPASNSVHFLYFWTCST